MPLKLVPKPEGFELAEKRANASDASRWLPEDALYAAWEEISETEPVKAFCVAWYVPGSKPGALKLRMRLYCEEVNDGTSLGTDIFHRLTDPPDD